MDGDPAGVTGARPLPPGHRRVRARRLLVRHRRLLAALLLAVAAGTATQAALAPAPTGSPVVVAGRDLAAGERLATADLAMVTFPAASVPAGTATSPGPLVGRTLAGPVRRGEPVSDVRLRGDGPLQAAPPGTVATAVAVADAATSALLVPGARVDLLTAGLGPDGAAAPAATVARGAVVLEVVAGAGVLDGSPSAAVVAVRPGEAAAVVGAQAVAPLGVVMLP